MIVMVNEPATTSDEHEHPADVIEDAPHSCQPPQDHLPEAGATWTCPECGRGWRLLDVEDDPAKGGPSQHMYWAVEGEPPPPKYDVQAS